MVYYLEFCHSQRLLQFLPNTFPLLVRACVGLKPQNHMSLEHKHSREVSQTVENGHKNDILNHVENGYKLNGAVNGETKGKLHQYINGDANHFSKVKQVI